MLTGMEIKQQVALGRIHIMPYDQDMIGTNSIDLHLGPTLARYDIPHGEPLDPLNLPRLIQQVIPPEGSVIRPGQLFLASTKERTSTDHYIPCISGRSSTGRLGIQVHQTAGFGDIGFRGQWTLELAVIQPVIIYPGMRIAQLYFYKPEGQVSLYHGRYQGQEGPTPSRFTMPPPKETR